MAILSKITCEQCSVTTHVSHSPADPAPKLCGACQGKNAEEKRRQALDRLAALPVEERLRRIEAWIYDYRPQYVDPPRF